MCVLNIACIQCSSWHRANTKIHCRIKGGWVGALKFTPTSCFSLWWFLGNFFHGALKSLYHELPKVGRYLLVNLKIHLKTRPCRSAALDTLLHKYGYRYTYILLYEVDYRCWWLHTEVGCFSMDLFFTFLHISCLSVYRRYWCHTTSFRYTRAHSMLFRMDANCEIIIERK